MQNLQENKISNSKEDTTSTHNWAFDLENMIGVCMGGQKDHPAILHCDAKKRTNNKIQLIHVNNYNALMS